MERQDGFAEVGPGRRVHYMTAGGGPDMVCFPGNGCSAGDFAPLIERLAPRYRCIGIDPPGREPTEWPDEEFRFHEDLPVVVDAALQTVGVGPHVALGHSMGGMFALHHARRHPDMVRGLVLLEGFVTLAIHRATVAPDGFGPIRMTPEVENAWRRRRAANAAWTRGRPRFQQSFWPSQQSHDARPWVADLAAPILVVIGEHGQRLPDGPDAWRRHLGMAGVRDLTVEVVPNAGHWMMLDDPEAVGSALTRFLDRVHPGRQA